MSRRTITAPVWLENARNLSVADWSRDPYWLINTIKRHDRLMGDLLDATDLTVAWGRPRIDGHWALVYLCFVFSDSVDMRPFWQSKRSDRAFWKACGFKRNPTYKTLYLRFCELEAHTEIFRAAAKALIAHARTHQPEIGRHVWLDFTEAQTHAELHYVGPNLTGLGDEQRAEALKVARAGWKRMDVDSQRGERAIYNETADPAEHLPEYRSDDLTRLVAGGAQRAHLEVEYTPTGRKQTWLRFLRGATWKGGQWVGGEWWRTLDTTAGSRFYEGRKSWHGFYNLKVVDYTTGAPLLCLVDSASINEAALWLSHIDEAIEHIGATPQTITADRGLSFYDVHEAHTRRKIASVIPLRGHRMHLVTKDHETHDRHGVQRCKHCGRECHRVDFQVEDGYAYIVGVCTGACPGRQKLACSTDWRRLGALEMTDVVYQELAAVHMNKENMHDVWRDSYKVAPDDLMIRPKRRGVATQQLRADAALLIEWLSVCQFNGWLPKSRRERRATGKLIRRIGHGLTGKRLLERDRQQCNLDLPYGPKADERYWKRLRDSPHRE